MGKSTKATVASNLTEIVLKVLGPEFEKGLTSTGNYLESQEKRLNRTIKISSIFIIGLKCTFRGETFCRGYTKKQQCNYFLRISSI